MKKANMMNQIDFHDILDEMLSEEVVKLVIKDVETFYKRKHGLSIGVLNTILVKTITATKGNTFNEAYLRKVAETFKYEEIKTVHSAIEHIERNHDHLRAAQNKNRSLEPEWLDDYLKNLANYK